VPPIDPQTLTKMKSVGQGAAARDIAFRAKVGRSVDSPGVFWLSGFMSDMSSTKASAVADWADARGIGSTLFDYSGHGKSGGLFTDGTIGRWLEEALAIFTTETTGPQVIIGSSMGGHIALLMLRQLAVSHPEHARRVKGCILIAPAWDMTEELMWKQFPEAARRSLVETGAFLRPSEYAVPYTITRTLIEEGRNHLLARQPFDPGCPVTILQGLQDVDVPPEHTRELLTFMKGNDVRLVEIADGEHRLSRPDDLSKLFEAIAERL
jgi:pimeloyl-ACP methyl ester carboxylesterase